MKQILLFGAIALSTLTFGQNVPSYVPTNGLVGWWPFNGNANDESGNGNNGTVNGATLTTDRNGASNNAYNFDGQSSFIEVTSNSDLSLTTSYSITAWFNVYDFNFPFPNESAIVSKIQNGNWYGGYEIKTTTNAGLSHTGNIGSNFNVGLSATLNSDEWYNVTVTYDGSLVKIYKNGIEIHSMSKTGSLQTSSIPLRFGRRGGAGSYNCYFNGDIDDIGIWNRALTQQEITDLYNASTCQTPTATITSQGNTTFCQGNSVVLEATSGSNYTYQWYSNDNTINGETNQTYTATTSGNYTVKVIDGTCDATSSATTVTVNSNPTVSFTLSNMISNDNGNVTLNGSPSGGTYSGNGITGNVFDPFSVGLGKQTIVYDYTDNNGCSGSASATSIIYDTTGIVCTSYVSVSVTDTLIIDVSLAGLTAPNNINTMKVYPNPSNDVVNIDNGDYALMNGYSIKIININAQEVFNSIINSQIIQIPVSQLGATGNYFINIYDNNLLLIESKILVLQ